MSKTSMSMHLTDHSGQIKVALEEQTDAILEAIGQQVAGSAKLKAPVDTGLLRNSLTYAIAGKEPVIKTYRGDNPSKYRNDTKIPEGHYNGSTTKAEGEHAVIIGTNVKYGVYQEFGTSKTKKQPFLKPAVLQEQENIKKMIELGLKGEL